MRGLTGKLFVIGGLFFLGWTLIHNKPSVPYEVPCKTYQGYTNERSMGKTILVFDKHIKKEREKEPEFIGFGNPDRLKIGEKYTLSVENSKPLDTIVSTTKCLD
jgi:hypothetical protein|tara:strand:- start:10097 stop:10408 length:312 start_codon:yes stop_codon:yes gene_type:complete